MNAEDHAIFRYRLDQLELRVSGDHEPRLRKLESMAVKAGVYSAMGASIGGAVVAAVVAYFFR